MADQDKPIEFEVKGRIAPTCATGCGRPAAHIIIGIAILEPKDGTPREHSFGLCEECRVSVKPSGRGTGANLEKALEDGVKLGNSIASLIVKVVGAFKEPKKP